jgi:hypothetical protein
MRKGGLDAVGAEVIPTGHIIADLRLNSFKQRPLWALFYVLFGAKSGHIGKPGPGWHSKRKSILCKNQRY